MCGIQKLGIESAWVRLSDSSTEVFRWSTGTSQMTEAVLACDTYGIIPKWWVVINKHVATYNLVCILSNHMKNKKIVFRVPRNPPVRPKH